MSVEVLEQNWGNINSKVIIPLWQGKFKSMYEQVKMDEDDFFSLADEELTKAFKTYNSDKSNIYTYATNVLTKKAFTELRNCTQREKRKALYLSESLDMPMSEDSEECGIDLIASKEKEDHSEVSELRIGSFVNSLNNNQLRVLILILLGFDNTDMPNMLNVTNRMASEIIRSLKDTDLTRILYRRNFK